MKKDTPGRQLGFLLHVLNSFAEWYFAIRKYFSKRVIQSVIVLSVSVMLIEVIQLRYIKRHFYRMIVV